MNLVNTIRESVGMEPVKAPEKRKKKVCIVGFAPSWKETPWQEDIENTEIWVLNEFYKVAPQAKGFRVDRWFEIHDLDSPSKNTPEHIAFLKQCPVPLYVREKRDDLPNSVVLPIFDIIAYFRNKGYQGASYLTNSISEMIAFAIYEGFKEVSVLGVDMSTAGEYGFQKPSCEYWLGVCDGLGIKLYIPDASELLKCAFIYGFESNNKLTAWMKAQNKELSSRAKQFQQQEQQAQQALMQAQIAQAELRGAQSAYKEVLKRRA
ncbi:MAG: hypothetical protein WC749_02360 [Dehalococcoidia bacterium]